MDEHGQSVQPAIDRRVGMVVQERYRIVRKLGEGGMGAVFEGEHLLIRRRVAIKALHAQFAFDPDLVARFQREAHAATSVGNEHIIEVTDMGVFPDGSPFLVLEYLDGSDLRSVIERFGPMGVSRAVHIATQVCDALGAAHAKGIVHRDLKPDNIFLIRRGEDPDFVKVLDFGISKVKDAADTGHGMTKTGVAIGTPYYMSPEQTQTRRGIDHRADIYALGVMMFRMLTAQHPFDAETFPALIVRICTAPPPPVRQLRPDVPEELEQIILRMLAKHPDDRFADCAAVKAVLAPFRSASTVPGAARPIPAPAPPAALADASAPAVRALDTIARAPEVTGPLVAPEVPTPVPPAPSTPSVGSRALLIAAIGVFLAGMMALAIALAGRWHSNATAAGDAERPAAIRPVTPTPIVRTGSPPSVPEPNVPTQVPEPLPTKQPVFPDGPARTSVARGTRAATPRPAQAARAASPTSSIATPARATAPPTSVPATSATAATATVAAQPARATATPAPSTPGVVVPPGDQATRRPHFP